MSYLSRDISSRWGGQMQHAGRRVCRTYGTRPRDLGVSNDRGDFVGLVQDGGCWGVHAQDRPEVIVGRR
jgi:hypothetical protein